ncbi:MAG: winged helix DNA-binding domain-containing protein [Chloroflexota bacterium]|nr:winged helix DNA-binding domain-containing protein [Chloroflexota bacterium]
MPRRATHALSLEVAVAAYRANVTRRHRVRNADQLVRFVDDCGFVFAFTTRTGDAAIPACFDHLSTADEGRKWAWMWRWKDELAEGKRLFYGKLLVRKPTFVSMKILPAFYATFGRAGEIDDHLDDVRAGRISDIGKRVIEHLAQHGETQTKRMRAQLGIVSDEGRREYAKAMEEVQRLMYVTMVRAVGEGREDYNYTYDLFVRRYPEAVRAAEAISSAEAGDALLARLVELAGAVTAVQTQRLFEWDDERMKRAIARSETAGALRRVVGGRTDLLILPALAGAASA